MSLATRIADCLGCFFSRHVTTGAVVEWQDENAALTQCAYCKRYFLAPKLDFIMANWSDQVEQRAIRNALRLRMAAIAKRVAAAPVYEERDVSQS